MTLPGTGRIKLIDTLPNPAAGQQIIVTVPAGLVWLPRHFAAVLVASGVAGTRIPSLRVKDGSGRIVGAAAIAASSGIGAGQTATFMFGVQSTETSITAFQTASATWGVAGIIPPILFPGYSLETAVQAFDAGDDWAAPLLLVEEWAV